MKSTALFPVLLLALGLCACTVGPDYVRPATQVPAKFKEAPKGWKIANPQDDKDRGAWWEVFRDPQLNDLETQLNISNQTIAQAQWQYQQALDQISIARAGYYPTITATAAITRSKSAANGGVGAAQSLTPTTGTGNVTPVITGGSGSGATYTTSHSWLIGATWVPDLWGSVRRAVEANISGSQASAAQLASARLSAQASLAEDYFQLRALDKDQQILDDTVKAYKESLRITQNQYTVGVAARADVVQAQTQLENAQAAAINNGISRAQTEHAIATLIGKPASVFSIPYEPLNARPPQVPISIPSELLERRPDVAQAERTMQQANAQIGVAVSAFYPTLTLTGTATERNNSLGHWFSLPSLSWAVGPQLAETLFDGGLRSATTGAAQANYQAMVASYKQTVLAAFQNVEDNLAQVRILEKEEKVQYEAAASALLAVKLVMNQYKAGLVDYSSVVTAQNTAYTAQKNAADITGLRMTATASLIAALGGGWDVGQIGIWYVPVKPA